MSPKADFETESS